jgi:hypothetical protein
VSERNLERASFLKSRRQRLTLEQVGLPHSPRRRGTTLRREDVAWLADVGITWYTWLEQGRPIKIAPSTVTRVAVALRLDASETEHLHKLVSTNHNDRPHWDASVAQRIRHLVESYTAGPAFVMGPRWDFLVWNERFGELYDLGDRSESLGKLERNGLWLMFMHPRARSLFHDWEANARSTVATFRAEYADYVGDRGFDELIDALGSRSPEFTELWAAVDVLSPMRWNVGEIRDPSSHKTLFFETASFAIPDSPGQTMVFFVPATSARTTT